MTDTIPLLDEADLLLQSLAETEDAHAEGAALYGPGGQFDHLRKSLLAVIRLRVRDALDGKKVTGLAEFIDDLAHADSGYTAFLNEHLIKQTQWRALDAERARHWMGIRVIQSRQYDARKFGA